MKIRTRQPADFDPGSPEAVRRFQKAAKASTARATKTKETALRTLVAEGIYTKSGKLTKYYR